MICFGYSLRFWLPRIVLQQTPPWLTGSKKLEELGACKIWAKLDERDLHLGLELDWITDESRLGTSLGLTRPSPIQNVYTHSCVPRRDLGAVQQ